MLDFLISSKVSFFIAALWLFAAVADALNGKFGETFLEVILAVNMVTIGMHEKQIEDGSLIRRSDLMKNV